MFITFEAGEGAGKSTQARILRDALEASGHEVILTREPGGSPNAEDIRALVLQGDPERFSPDVELLLFNAARRDHIERVVRPSLERGAIVICDRYVGSTYALQGVGGMPMEKMKTLHDLFIGLDPDLTLFLEMDADQAMARALDRLTAENSAENRMEAKGLEYHRKVVANFRSQCAQNTNWTSINADQSIENVARDIIDVVTSHALFKARQAV